MLDPTTVFDHPDDVIASTTLTDAQKMTVLERWRVEAARLADAAAGVDPRAAAEARSRADDVDVALRRLGNP